jgi:hypothetical protein
MYLYWKVIRGLCRHSCIIVTVIMVMIGSSRCGLGAHLCTRVLV